jgi:hypothetical protein
MNSALDKVPFGGLENRCACDTPGVYFMSCREICPKLGSSVEIMNSRSCISPFVKISPGSFTKFGVIGS